MLLVSILLYCKFKLRNFFYVGINFGFGIERPRKLISGEAGKGNSRVFDLSCRLETFLTIESSV